MNREPIKIIASIIKEVMALEDGQIFIYNQNFKLPSVSGLFIVIQQTSSQNFASNNNFVPTEAGADENMAILTREEYAINILSKDESARQRKEEIILALNSNYSQNQQGLYQFQIGRISNGFTNVSELEGANVINRFVINIALKAHYSKSIATDYYDTFTNSTQIN